MTDQLEEDTEEVKETSDTEFVIEKSPIQFEKKSEEPTTERISNETVQKLEQELSSAAAAMAQLQLEGQSKPTVSGETGQDLMSFEMLDMSPRGSNKMSQTATPNNTPLGIYIISSTFLSNLWLPVIVIHFINDIECVL